MKTLAILGVPGAAARSGKVVIRSHFGLVVDELARHFEKVILAVPQLPTDDGELDHVLADNVHLEPLPAMVTAARGFFLQGEIARIYQQVIAQADAVFVRGVMIPAVPSIFREAARQDIPVIHWLVGNPHALIRSHQRDGWLKDTLGKVFIWNWERQVRQGARQGRATLLCNGREIAGRYGDAPAQVTVSTTLQSPDITDDRQDTCQEDPVRLITVATVRPEKGVEYLLEALSLLRTQRPILLTVAGSRQRYPAYQAKLDHLVSEFGLQEKVRWAGHILTQDLFGHLDQSDLFVLPTLSEGTPRVLLEAQARGLPVIASNVGGIPDSISHEKNGLLVPAKDPASLAQSLDRLLEDGSLRRQVIAGGYENARQNTLDVFARHIMNLFRELQRPI